jgi:hypothetical protein
MDESAIKEIIKQGNVLSHIYPVRSDVDVSLMLSDRDVSIVDLEPAPKPLNLHTLSGLIDYCANHLDDEEKYLVHVVDYNRVRVYGKYEKNFGRRKMYVEAESMELQFSFGNWYDHETFVIKLQSVFQKTEHRDLLLDLISSIKMDDSVTSTDDGVSQTVVVKSGIAKVKEQALPNPVHLAPYRTFTEIDQVEAPLVLRMNKQHGVQFSLHEADGGAWRKTAILRIKEYLEDKLPVGTTIIA